MNEELIRKDIFDLHMQRMEAVTALNLTEQKAISERLDRKIDALTERMEQGFALMNERIERNLAEYKALLSDTRSELKEDISETRAEFGEIRGDVKALTARLDTQQTKFGWLLTVFGLVITVTVAVIQFWK